MIILKDSSVVHQGLVCEMYFALGVASALKKKMFGMDTVVTSLLEGAHNDGSLHPQGRAADLRDSDMTPIQRMAWFTELKAQLEPMGFDVVFEGATATVMTTAGHLHVEEDPKGRIFWRVL